MYVDSKTAKEVLLMVYMVPYATPPHDKHWALVWQVGSSANTPVYCQCEAVREGGRLVNPGPMTRIARHGEQAQGHSLGLVSYENRQKIEKAAAREPALAPNSQTWPNFLYPYMCKQMYLRRCEGQPCHPGREARICVSELEARPSFTLQFAGLEPREICANIMHG